MACTRAREAHGRDAGALWAVQEFYPVTGSVFIFLWAIRGHCKAGLGDSASGVPAAESRWLGLCAKRAKARDAPLCVAVPSGWLGPIVRVADPPTRRGH
jgi:hypothetical protein